MELARRYAEKRKVQKELGIELEQEEEDLAQLWTNQQEFKTSDELCQIIHEVLSD